MGVDKILLPIPFATGIAQREDPRYLQPGQLISAQNTVHPKSNVAGKRNGLAALASASVATVGTSTTAIAMGAGRGLGSYKNNLAIIADLKDVTNSKTWTPSIWQYDEATAAPVYKDFIPEVYAYPDRAVTGGDKLVLDMDTAVANGFAVHVWLDPFYCNGSPDLQLTGTAFIVYQVENALTGEVVIPASPFIPRVVDVNAIGFLSPKIVACGTTMVLTFECSGGAAPGLYATAMSVANASALFWHLPQLIVAMPTSNANPGTYDLSDVVGDATTYALFRTTGNSQVITLFQCSAANTLSGGSAVLASAAVQANDTTWTGDGAGLNTPIGMALRADATNNEVAMVYGWANATATRVSLQIVKWSGAFGAVLATAANLLSSPGVYHPVATDAPPRVIAVERYGVQKYNVKFSPLGAGIGWDVGFVGTAGASPAYIATYITSTSAGAVTIVTTHVTYGVRLASRMYVNPANKLAYLIGYMPSGTQGTHFVFCDDFFADTFNFQGVRPFRLVGILAPRLASSMVQNGLVRSPLVLPHLASNPTFGGNVRQTILPITQGQISIGAPTLFQFDFSSPLAYQIAEIGEHLGIACAAPTMYDGSMAYEFGFPYYPFVAQLTTSTSGGNIGTGSFNYIVLYEFRDARGVRHRSARSVVANVITGAGSSNSNTLLIPRMDFTSRERAALNAIATNPEGYYGVGRFVSCTIRVYRTAAGGTTYYNIDSTDVVNNTSFAKLNTNPASSQPPNPFITIVDTVADTTLLKNEQLYGDGSDGTQPGNIIDAECPPAFQAIIVHKNRFFGIDGRNVWATKALTSGEGPAFNELMAFSVDDGSNVCTALASMDDKLVIFKRDRLLIVTGEGPTDDGGNNDWSQPQRISSDVGAIDWRSVVSTQNGVYFMSDAGLRLLTRDLQVQQVTNAEDVLRSNPAVTSAVLHPSLNRVVWTANTDDLTAPRNGVDIDFDYILGSWMTSLAQDAGTTVGAVRACVANATVSGTSVPTYHYLRADGIVWRENVAGYMDGQAAGGSVYVPMSLETAWVKANEIDGFARFRRLQLTWENRDPHQLSVYVSYDFAPSGTAPTYYLLATVTASQMQAMATPLCQVQFALPRQRAAAVRFKIVDAADVSIPPVTGQGPMLISMGVEIGIERRKRVTRLPAGQRF